jgi:hypothetical protein
LEVRIDETRGVPAVTGSTTVTLANYTCGQPLTSSGFTVTTTVVTGGCQFSFDQDVQVITAADYQSIPELKGATNLVQRVELNVKKLAFSDGASGAVLDLSTRVTSATLSVNSQLLADKASLSSLPRVVVLSGASLTALKAQIDARQPASVHATVVVVIPDSPKPPDSLKIDYDAQPAVIVGPGTISLP